ncbi:plancitoxin-1 [Drosophila subobscura]|uniref:plancitoxin-1 n=1 Tax=Drosophila subobscura TaxID=7241 RepID=UPI00155B01FE|nr:plancitoxin-1 [Drosophila subobscura]
MKSLCAVLLLMGFSSQCWLTQANDNKKVSCKDEQGNDVDWWHLYKLPKHYQQNDLGKDVSGLRYLYVTSNSYDSWQLSGKRVSDADSLPAQTINALNADPKHILLAAYNDEWPNGTVFSTGGHTKGLVGSDGQTGVWLVHSVPKFPTLPDYAYPTTGEQYAQSMLCITVKAEDLEKVGQALVYNEPHFYYERNPLLQRSDLLFPSLERAMHGQWRTESPYQTDLELRSLGCKKFRVFGKSGRANVELYADVVAPALDVSLFVEAWRDGAGNLANRCDSSDKVFNVESVADLELSVNFKTTQDHSKWAVSRPTGILLYHWRVGGGDWICVGDINRQQAQLGRGGGTLCHKSSRVSNLYRNLVANYDKCAEE